jgi:ATP-dependent DNA helicase RecG
MGLEDIVPAEGDSIEAIQEEPVRPKPRRKSRRGELPADAVERLHGLSAPVTVVERVGERVSSKLARLGLYTVEYLLYHLPRRYDDYTRMAPIHRAKPGEVYTLIGSVRTSMIHKARTGREFLQVTLDDGTATLEVFFFRQPYLARQLKRGVQVVVSGKTESHLGKLSMSNPEWELLEFENLHTRSIVPVYPLTKGLTGRTMRRILKTTVDYWAGRLPDYVPESVLDRADLVDLGWALRQVHFPEHWDYLRYARERLAFDELLILQLAMLARRRAWQQVPGLPLAVDEDWLAGLTARLPFVLTGAQQQALSDIRADMARNVPMNRLLQGDVGSGKTVVAALAMAIAVQNGGQAALMAPTSILAEQHFQSITATLAALLPDREIAIRLLTGATPPAERDETLARLADGTVSIVIGTHALIQAGSVPNLTLRSSTSSTASGEQRGQLRGKGTNPHLQ